jgi:NAD-reducing hydrogenase small subunit
VKEFPLDVDVTLVEGSVSTVEDLAKIRRIRERTKILIALGDCAVTGNVPSMRNLFDTRAVCDRAYDENVDVHPQMPGKHLPVLLKRVRPVHEVVKVDVFIPGCPPPADAIHSILNDLLAGREPHVSTLTRFGR